MDTVEAKDFMNKGICVKECPSPEKSYQDQTKPTTLETGTKGYSGVSNGKITLDHVFITRSVLHYCVPRLSAIKGTAAAKKWELAYS